MISNDDAGLLGVIARLDGATPKRWLSSFVEGYDQPRLMGVAIAIYFPGHITCLFLAVHFLVVHLGIFSFPSSKSGFSEFSKGMFHQYLELFVK